MSPSSRWFAAVLILSVVSCTSSSPAPSREAGGLVTRPPAPAAAAPPATSTIAAIQTAATPPSVPDVRMIRFEGGRLHTAGHDDEVEVAPFLLDVTEVTAGAYTACVKAGSCVQPGIGGTCTFEAPGKESYPINCVSWNDAVAFSTWAGKRLPTEAEWEWAARGGTAARKFPWGDAPPLDQLCWNGRGNRAGAGRRDGPCPAGVFPEGNTPEGLSDMAGNVQEWTSTVFKVGARVTRGGSWFHEDDVDLMTTRRASYSPGVRDNAIGFRCARTP